MAQTNNFNSQVSLLLEELDGLSDEDILRYGVTLTIRKSWYVRFSWNAHEEPLDTSPIRHLLTVKEDMFRDVITSKNIGELVRNLKQVQNWISPRGYTVGLSGMNFWSRTRLTIYAWLGGFR